MYRSHFVIASDLDKSAITSLSVCNWKGYWPLKIHSRTLKGLKLFLQIVTFGSVNIRAGITFLFNVEQKHTLVPENKIQEKIQ